MNTLKIRDLVVGEGAPKIIVPIVGKTMQQILDKADELKYYTYDVVEWRVDFYEHALDIGKVLEAAPKAAVVASHMDNVGHATLWRRDIHAFVEKDGLQERLLIPEDGETCSF